jgi:UMF1 family MFS transporter
MVTAATGSQRLGVSPVILLFLIGLGLLYWVKTDNEQPGTPHV